MALALPCLAAAAPDPVQAPSVPVHVLDNGTVRATVTPAIGGRLLAFGLADKPSFLRLDLAAGDPGAAPDVTAENVGYLGHEVWVGPQKEWWVHQALNPARAAAKATWPPDPYLSLAPYAVEEAGATAVTLRGPASPVTGIALRKRYALVPGRPNSLRLEVDATNGRDTQVAWDIWFNTRAHADTVVYLPVAAAGDVRVEAALPDRPAPTFTLAEGVFALDVPDAPRKGKVFVQPAAGWMAGFRGGQALVVQFAHQPRAAIHPAQGQVELYHDLRPGQPDAGMLEMEVHAPYRRLAPGQAMNAVETWTILPYAGRATRAAHLAFLRTHARTLGLEGL
jgi:hypothetical protein